MLTGRMAPPRSGTAALPQRPDRPVDDVRLTVLPGSAGDFSKLIVEDTDKWAKVVKFAGIKAD
jgi:hypothetical protein